MKCGSIVMMAALMAPALAMAQPAEDPPLMDSPPLPWFHYTMTEEGSPTFLSKACADEVRIQNDISVHPCAVAEAETHRRVVASHDAAAAKVAALGQYESDISSDYAEMRKMQRLMADERAAGRISGYVDARKLHDYAERIVLCERRMASTYAAYRNNGGRKAPVQIYGAGASRP
jgi:hypothetical protein